MHSLLRYTPYIISVLSWFVVEAGNIYSAHPRKEVWDNPDYFTLGLPFIYIVAGLLGWFFPSSQKSWQWGIIPFATQFCMMFLRNPTGNLLPLGMILLVILSLPAIGCALLGAYLHNRFKKN